MVPVINAVDLITGWHFLVNKAFNRKKKSKKKKLTYSPRDVDVSWAGINVGQCEVQNKWVTQRLAQLGDVKSNPRKERKERNERNC